jgi:hypothetical protein
MVLGAAVPVPAASLAAQGLTGGAIEGRIVGVDSTPVEQAIVRVANPSNGERWQTTTGARGRYFLDNLSVGGPYRIEVLAVGYEPARQDGIHLGLGQRLTVNLALTPAVVQLQEITVTAAADPRLSAARSGPAQFISDSTIARLPVNRRDYTELALLSPQVTKSPNGGLSFAGQHDRYNSIQVDGTGNSDPFRRSFSGNGTLGWFVGLTAFTPEAVKELQVVSAPFDVRYGSFAGGLINAVTKSGSNRVEGSILGYFENAELAATEPKGSRASEFSRKELGLTLGAPIVRDRVAVFVNADLKEEVIPQTVPAPAAGVASPGGSVPYDALVRFQSLLRGYGVEPGDFSSGATSSPNGNLFVKLTAQLGVNSRLMVSHDYGHGRFRDEALARDPTYYALSSSANEWPETITATRLAWTTAFAGRLSNELVLARAGDRWTCNPRSNFATVSVRSPEYEVIAGAALGCLGIQGGSTTWEITDNLGMAAGNHRITVGVHGERIDLEDTPGGFGIGLWVFDSLGALEQGHAASYTRDFFTTADSQVSFRVSQVGGYVQDQWLPTPHLTVTAGLRLDVPFVPQAPVQNPMALRELGINTAITPSGNVLWSPRLGVNYDPVGRGTTVLRGGAGLFAGPPPLVWFRNVYLSNGIRAGHIECSEDEVPGFTVDPENQPTKCAKPTSQTFPPVYFDPELRFPQTLKVALGVDHLLPGGMVGTLDLLYTRGVHTVHSANVNLVGPIDTAAGEGGRVMYGTIDPETGEARPYRVSDSLPRVYELRNGAGGDRSYSVTAQLGKRFPNGAELSAAYTYTDATDRMSMDQNMPDLVTGSTPVDGTLEHRELRTSLWERPHKLTLVATTDLPFGFRFGFTYIGMSGAPFTYVLGGDPNADSFRPDDISNDVLYVPRDAGDVTLLDPEEYAQLDRAIRDEPCLRSQRGRLLERNSCRDPWVHETSARLAKRFRLAGRQTLEVTADLFNVLNLVDGDWGVVRHTAVDVGNVVPLLNLVGYDPPNGRGVYSFLPPERRQVDVDASRWRIQLGATLSF